MITLIIFLVLWFQSGILITAHWCSKNPSYVLDSEFLGFLFGAGLMGPNGKDMLTIKLRKSLLLLKIVTQNFTDLMVTGKFQINS